MSKKLSRNIEDIKNTHIKLLLTKISEMKIEGIEKIVIGTIYNLKQKKNNFLPMQRTPVNYGTTSMNFL